MPKKLRQSWILLIVMAAVTHRAISVFRPRCRLVGNFILAALACASGSVHGADFQSDRKLRASEGGRVARVYVGMRSGTAYGSGWTEDFIIRKYGLPAERRKISESEELLIYRGPKTLFRGTRENNASVGLEWREIRMRKGAAVDETEAVQMFDLHDSWNRDREFHTYCESYGSSNTTVCIGVAPVEPLPAMSAAAPPPFDYSCPENTAQPHQGKRGVDEGNDASLRDFVIAELSTFMGPDHALGVSIPRRPTAFLLGMNMTAEQAADDESAFIVRRCAKTIGLSIHSKANDVGTLTVGVCDRQKELTRSDACTARSALTQTVLGLDLNRADPIMHQSGIPPRTKLVQGGASLDYFAVIAIGHGIGFFRTSILTPANSRQSVAIQANIDVACSRQPQWQFCTDTEAALAQVAEAIVERFFSN